MDRGTDPTEVSIEFTLTRGHLRTARRVVLTRPRLLGTAAACVVTAVGFCYVYARFTGVAIGDFVGVLFAPVAVAVLAGLSIWRAGANYTESVVGYRFAPHRI